VIASEVLIAQFLFSQTSFFLAWVNIGILNNPDDALE
jgi:hypothetical protein